MFKFKTGTLVQLDLNYDTSFGKLDSFQFWAADAANLPEHEAIICLNNNIYGMIIKLTEIENDPDCYICLFEDKLVEVGRAMLKPVKRNNVYV